MSADIARWVFGSLVGTSAAGCVTFILLYWLWFPWWRREAGRHLMSFVAALGALDVVYLIALVARPGWQSALRLVLILVYAPQPFLVWWRVAMLARTHARHPSTERHDTGGQP